MLAAYILCGLVFVPKVCLAAAKDALSLCVCAVIPSLFPFFVCSEMMVKNGFAEKLSRPLAFLVRPLFNVPGCGAFAFAVGVLSGCPVGASVVSSLLSSGSCNKTEAQRMLCFCNNSGPLFVIGSVAVGMFGFEEVGKILYASHVISAAVLGFFMSFYKRNDKSAPSLRLCRKGEGISFPEAVSVSVNRVLGVCGFVVFFAVTTAVLRHSGMVETLLSRFGASEIVYGMVEMTNGISLMAKGAVTVPCLSAVSFVLGFGGVSVIMQVGAAVSGSGLSLKIFAAAKLFQGAVSALVTFLLLSVSEITLPSFAQKGGFGAANGWAFSINLMSAFGIIVLIMSIISTACKNMRRM